MSERLACTMKCTYLGYDHGGWMGVVKLKMDDFTNISVLKSLYNREVKF